MKGKLMDAPLTWTDTWNSWLSEAMKLLDVFGENQSAQVSNFASQELGLIKDTLLSAHTQLTKVAVTHAVNVGKLKCRLHLQEQAWRLLDPHVADEIHRDVECLQELAATGYGPLFSLLRLARTLLDLSASPGEALTSTGLLRKIARILQEKGANGRFKTDGRQHPVYTRGCRYAFRDNELQVERAAEKGQLPSQACCFSLRVSSKGMRRSLHIRRSDCPPSRDLAQSPRRLDHVHVQLLETLQAYFDYDSSNEISFSDGSRLTVDAFKNQWKTAPLKLYSQIARMRFSEEVNARQLEFEEEQSRNVLEGAPQPPKRVRETLAEIEELAPKKRRRKTAAFHLADVEDWSVDDTSVFETFNLAKGEESSADEASADRRNVLRKAGSRASPRDSPVNVWRRTGVSDESTDESITTGTNDVGDTSEDRTGEDTQANYASDLTDTSTGTQD